MWVFGGTAADIAVRLQDDAEFGEGGQYLGTYFTLLSDYDGCESDDDGESDDDSDDDGCGSDEVEDQDSGGDLEAGEHTYLTGALYGNDVEVDEDSTITGMPSVAAYLAFFGL